MIEIYPEVDIATSILLMYILILLNVLFRLWLERDSLRSSSSLWKFTSIDITDGLVTRTNVKRKKKEEKVGHEKELCILKYKQKKKYFQSVSVSKFTYCLPSVSPLLIIIFIVVKEIFKKKCLLSKYLFGKILTHILTPTIIFFFLSYFGRSLFSIIFTLSIQNYDSLLLFMIGICLFPLSNFSIRR